MIDRNEARKELWRRGILRWKLKPAQKRMYDDISSSTKGRYVINCSRRLGKTYLLATMGAEKAIKSPGSMIRFASPTNKQLKKILLPIFRVLLSDCPEDIKPVFLTQDSVFRFPNGSEIHLAGTDAGNAESLRGTAADLCIIDEAGSIDHLDYLIDDVLLPQLIGSKGKILIASTPPVTPDHPFKTLCDKAKEDGNYSHFTIFDSHYDKETIETFIEESGGIESTTCQREYLARFVLDTNYSIIPEFDDSCVTEITRDEYYHYYHKYVSMDLGVRDLTAGILAFYDFKNATLSVEGEFEISGPEMTTDRLKNLIMEKETSLGYTKPYRRIADNNNPLLLQDLSIVHKVHFIPVEKTDLHGMVNRTRLMFSQNRIKISPSCKRLIGSLKSAIWQDSRKAFARSPIYGHYDHVIALVYLVMMLDTVTNPIPKDHGFDPQTSWIAHDPYSNMSKNSRTVANLFPTKRTLKGSQYYG